MRVIRGIIKGLLWTLAAVVLLVALVVGAVYTPVVQDWAVSTLLPKVNSETLHISLERLRLRWPLELELDSLRLETPDMTLRLAHAQTAIKIEPLLRKTVATDDLRLRGGFFDLHLQPTDTAVAKPPSQPLGWVLEVGSARLDSVTYTMAMPPTIAEIHANIGTAQLRDLRVDMRSEEVQVEIRHARIADTEALYAALLPAPETPNFDPSYIQATGIEMEVDSFYNCLTDVRLPIRRFSGRERCGIPVEITGLFDMDSVEMRLRGMKLRTPTSWVDADATMGLSPDLASTPLSLQLGADLSADDLRRLAPAEVANIVDMLPPYAPLRLEAELHGTFANLDLQRLEAQMPDYFTLAASGKVDRVDSLALAQGHIDLQGTLRNGAFVKSALLDAQMQREVNIPPLALSGDIDLDRGDIDGTLSVATGNGKLLLDAAWDNRHEGYFVDLRATTFPVQSLLPGLGMRNLTATLHAEGQGLDFLSPHTWAQADIDLRNVEYRGYDLHDASLTAALRDGHATASLDSRNRPADLTLAAAGNLDGSRYQWHLDGDIRNLDLQALGLASEVMEGSVKFSGDMDATTSHKRLKRHAPPTMVLDSLRATLDIAQLYWRMPGSTVNAADVNLQAALDSANIQARLSNQDLQASLQMQSPLDSLMPRLDRALAVVDYAFVNHHAYIDSLQQALPPFRLHVKAGANNFLANYLQSSDISFSSFDFKAQNDSLLSASLRGLDIVSGSLRLDTVSGALQQVGDRLNFDFRADNAPGTLDQFAHVVVNGNVSPQRLALFAKQQDIKGQTGYSLGAMATMTDSTTISLHFVPYHPIIAYKDWEVNRDNRITYNLRTHHLDADLNLHNNVSSIRLFTDHQHWVDFPTAQLDAQIHDITQDTASSQALTPNHSTLNTPEDLVVELRDIKLSDWVALNPFAPPIRGDLSADVRLCYLKPNVNGQGLVTLSDLSYGRRRVGTFELGFNVATNPGGSIRADGGLKVDGRSVATLAGALNDSTATSPLALDLRLTSFPLAIANPFLPPQTASLSGALSGDMAVSGTATAPMLNGWLAFDTTAVTVDMLGTPFRFSDTRVSVDSNLVSFRDFAIIGVNDKPLTVNGTLDFRHLMTPKIDLSLQAQNMQVVGSKQSRRSQVYGKAFVNVGATARGSLSFLDVDATLELLPETNVTYVMANAQEVLTARSNQNMVKFVNFADTAAVEHADTVAAPQMLMNIDATLIVDPGSTVNVDLSTDGRNKVKLMSSGTLSYSEDYMGDERFTGRLNINSGFVRYTPPLMSEKLFNFQEGSYVAFNGDMLNPTLNVVAVDQVKSSVSTDGNSRMVNFDVSLNITGTLDQVDAKFDLSAANDVTVENELQGMSPEQRANQAMNLLLYGAYRGGSSHSLTGGGNALYSFLEGQLNSWASQAIKGVDISFGISQFDTSTDGRTSTAMNYSYQVSKSLFDDRFKIVIGGNYTTDTRADENFAQNLIADISFEYMLNRSGTMYIRLFRHTGYESILEGEITKTGVGFVYKRKIQRVGDLFRFHRK